MEFMSVYWWLVTDVMEYDRSCLIIPRLVIVIILM